jgi:hypothetical protein
MVERTGRGKAAAGFAPDRAGDGACAAAGAQRGRQATGVSSTATGGAAWATGDFSTATGVGAHATGIGSTATGVGAQATADNATALGRGATAGFANSMALGQGVATTRADQVMVGTATNTYTLAGVASAQSRAAQTGPTNFVTSDQAGNLATSNYGPTDVAALDSRVTTLENSAANIGANMARNLAEARSGTALALAAASMRFDDTPGKLSVAGGLGYFKGMTGLSFGVGYAASNSFRFNASVSGVPQTGDMGVGAGFSWTLN